MQLCTMFYWLYKGFLQSFFPPANQYSIHKKIATSSWQNAKKQVQWQFLICVYDIYEAHKNKSMVAGGIIAWECWQL